MFKHQRHPFLQSMVVEKKAMMQAGIFDESLCVAEDTQLIYRLVLAFGYAVVNARLVGIHRDRNHRGLSDTMDPASACKRYDCYIRVQADAYWRLVPLDDEAATIIRGKMFYFVSRLAEFACAHGEEWVAKRYARSGLGPHGGWKCLVRNLLILGVYPLAARWYSRKWAC